MDLHERGIKNVFHYLDDFLLLGNPESTECAQALATLIATCKELGLPLASDKCEGPTSKLTFLGIEIDTRSMEMLLPQEKISCLSTATTIG